MGKLPEHGKIKCRECYSGNGSTKNIGKWKMRNDPGAWGSESPKYIVLGFSKGATQADIYKNGPFDEVAFGGVQTRNNLTDILNKIGMLYPKEHVNEKIKAGEKEFHFGSLVRCSLARLNEKKYDKDGTKTYETSGSLIVKSFSEIQKTIDHCFEKYLLNLPESVRAVFVLGTNDAYIKNMKALVKRLYGKSYKEINPIAYQTGKVLWLHLTHPSKGNGHLVSWLNTGVTDPSGKKRNIAIKTMSDLNLRRGK